MGERQRKADAKKSGQPSAITTTNKNFDLKLQRNNIVCTAPDAQAPDDIRELWYQSRKSEELPTQQDFNQYLLDTQGTKNELTIEFFAYPLLAKRIPYERKIRL